MKNLDLERERDLSMFRRIALGTWETTRDPSVYGSLTLRMDAALAYVEAFRAATGRHLTVTHLMARAVGHVLAAHPEANVVLRAGQIYRRRDVGVFFQVAMRDPATGKLDLSGATIHEPQRKTLVEICDELERRFAAVRASKDRELGGVRGALARIPQLLMPAVLELTAKASYTLNLDLRWAGVPRDAFGSVMITNVGALGLDEAYVPLVAYSRVPLLLALGAIREVPVAQDGVVSTAHVMKVCATFDHRILDGSHAAAMATTLRAWLEDPRAHFDPIPERGR